MAPDLHLAVVHEMNIKCAIVMNCRHRGFAVFAAFGVASISIAILPWSSITILPWKSHAHSRLNRWELHDELLLQAILWIWHLVLPRVECEGDLKTELDATSNHEQNPQRGGRNALLHHELLR